MIAQHPLIDEMNKRRMWQRKSAHAFQQLIEGGRVGDELPLVNGYPTAAMLGGVVCRRKPERVTLTRRTSLACATRSSRAHSERLGRRAATGLSASRARLREPNSVSEKRMNSPARRGC